MEETNIISSYSRTGFPVEKTVRWETKEHGEYLYCFTRIGDSTVMVANAGDMNNFSVATHYELLHRFAKEKLSGRDIIFGYTIDPDVPVNLFGDAISLEKIMHHIIGNAIKFVEQGSVRVHITRQSETGEHISLLFEITDTGIGIPESRQEGLFDLFTQADASTTRKYGGAGLGLSITKRLVDLLKGDIGFDSRKGRGRRFWFRVEFQKQERETVAPKKPVTVMKKDLLARELTKFIR